MYLDVIECMYDVCLSYNYSVERRYVEIIGISFCVVY